MTHVTKPKTRQSRLTPDSAYRDNTSTGFPRAGKKWWQAHHLLSITCMAKRVGGYPTGTKKYIEDCLYCAKWDINDGHNMLGLPTNRQYRRSNGQVPVDIPSHQVDHNTADGYTKEVSTWLKTNLWTTLQSKQKIHQVDVTKVETQLKGCSDFFRKLLTVVYPKRPLPAGGTQVAWSNRFSSTWQKKWYQPFSMANKASPRSPGKSTSNMAEIFKKIG